MIGDLPKNATAVPRVSSGGGNAGMSDIWAFIRRPSNQKLLTWLGGGGAVAAAGIWAVVTYIWPTHEAPKVECAQQGSIASGRDASGNTVNYNGGALTGGVAVSCTDAARK